MAIQIPNPGTGNGATGDNEFVLWSKVKDNFSNTDHAASRLVGTANKNIPEYAESGISDTGFGGISKWHSAQTDIKTFNTKTQIVSGNFTGYLEATKFAGWQTALVIANTSNSGHRLIFSNNASERRLMWQRYTDTGTVDETVIYHTGNTTKEAETGYLVASSPVLKVRHDSFEKVHESEQLDIDVQHLETGVYAITGTTGLRENDGWNLKPPKDVNGNVLCICEATQDGDVITLKTYKKKFDFETVSIVADYEQPTDIPDGAEVLLRFNDLSAEPMPPEV